MKRLPCVILIAGLTVVAGCETETPYFDSQLGSSSANLVTAQTLYPAVVENPAPLAPPGADGQRMKSAVDQYHKDVPKSDQPISRPIVFEVGNGGGGGG
jgi:hypothetical protein